MTLADLKRELSLGKKLTLVFQYGKKVTLPREVVKIQSNGVWMKRPDSPKNSFLEYPKASLLEISMGGFKIYNTGKRPLTTQEKSVKVGFEKIRDKKQEAEDIMTDSTTSYWQAKRYYIQHNAEYLMGSTTQRGMRYDHNTGFVYDDNVKGDLVLEYVFA